MVALPLPAQNHGPATSQFVWRAVNERGPARSRGAELEFVRRWHAPVLHVSVTGPLSLAVRELSDPRPLRCVEMLL